jgi:hypothetical protein
LPEQDFTHYIPLAIQQDIIKNANNTSEDEMITYSYRTDVPLGEKEELSSLLFFPLAIGRRLIFNSIKDSSCDMWSRNYFPSIVKRIVDALYPELSARILLRQEFEVQSPKNILTNKISINSIFHIMKEASSWKQKNALSDELFIRYDQSRKPIYINLKNPFLVYEFMRLTKEKENISVSNSIPDINGLWLSNEEGQFSTEFRYMVAPYTTNEILQGKRDGITVLYLPGYKSRLDELVYMKKALAEQGITVDVQMLDYNRPVHEILLQMKEYIASQRYQNLVVIGLSYGAVIAIKLLEASTNALSRVIAINPFYDRGEVLTDLKYRGSYEQITLRDSTFDYSKLVVITALQDANISPAQSTKIVNKSEKVKQYSIPGNHTFSNLTHQQELARIVTECIENNSCQGKL